MHSARARVEVGERRLRRRAGDDPPLIGRQLPVVRAAMRPGTDDDAVAGEHPADPGLLVDPLGALEQQLRRLELDLDARGRRVALLEVEQPLVPEEEILDRLLDRLRERHAHRRLVEERELDERLAERHPLQPAVRQRSPELFATKMAVGDQMLAIVLRHLVRTAVEDLAGTKADPLLALAAAHDERAGHALGQSPLQEVRGRKCGQPAGELHARILARTSRQRAVALEVRKRTDVSAWGPRCARSRKPTLRSD